MTELLHSSLSNGEIPFWFQDLVQFQVKVSQLNHNQTNQQIESELLVNYWQIIDKSRILIVELKRSDNREKIDSIGSANIGQEIELCGNFEDWLEILHIRVVKIFWHSAGIWALPRNICAASAASAAGNWRTRRSSCTTKSRSSMKSCSTWTPCATGSRCYGCSSSSRSKRSFASVAVFLGWWASTARPPGDGPLSTCTSGPLAANHSAYFISKKSIELIPELILQWYFIHYCFVYLFWKKHFFIKIKKKQIFFYLLSNRNLRKEKN